MNITAIPGHDYYYADKEGNIYSVTPADKKKFFNYRHLKFKQVNGLQFYNEKAGTIQLQKLRPLKNGNGYLSVRLSLEGKKTKEYIHRLILMTFKGPFPAGKQTNHKDLNRANNKLSNLEFVTPSENMLHARAAQYGDITKTKEGDPF